MFTLSDIWHIPFTRYYGLRCIFREYVLKELEMQCKLRP